MNEESSNILQLKKENGCCQEKQQIVEVRDVPSAFNKVDTVSSIAQLSLTIIDLQKAIGGIQGALQQFGMNLSQLGQAHNELAKMVESLMSNEAKAETSGKPAEAPPVC